MASSRALQKFTTGTNYHLVDTATGRQNNLGTGRIFVPVEVISYEDGEWDWNAYKTVICLPDGSILQRSIFAKQSKNLAREFLAIVEKFIAETGKRTSY